MQTTVTIALFALCACLACWIIALEWGMREARKRLQQHLKNETTARLDVPCASRGAEGLLEEMNALLARRQEELAYSRKQEEDLRAQIANISHDLRTPLTAILGYLQLLETEPDPEKRKEYLQVIRGRAETLQTLITGFYDLSRVEGGQWPLTPEPVDLRRELSDLLAAGAQQLEAEGLAVRVYLEEGLPQIWADRKAVVRIFSNLLTNALEHAAPPLTIRLYREGGEVVTAFSNPAPDMTEEDAARVFERFYTADKMRTGKNTGLGLAIVRALTQRMGHRCAARLDHGEFCLEIRWHLPDAAR